MLALKTAQIRGDLRVTANYGAALLHAIARSEAAGRRFRVATEAGLATWSRFRGRLGCADLLRLLAEDAAVRHPVPFDPALVLEPGTPGLEALPEDLVAGWMAELGELELGAAGLDYIQAQAKLLGLPTRMARADLHQVKPHQKVLELPGSGGQLAHHIVSTQPGIFLQDNFLVACGSWQELALAGLVAVDLDAPSSDFARLDPDLAYARDDSRRTAFDFVIGLQPDKGGQFESGRLKEVFPNARVVLV